MKFHNCLHADVPFTFHAFTGEPTTPDEKGSLCNKFNIDIATSNNNLETASQQPPSRVTKIENEQVLEKSSLPKPKVCRSIRYAYISQFCFR